MVAAARSAGGPGAGGELVALWTAPAELWEQREALELRNWLRYVVRDGGAGEDGTAGGDAPDGAYSAASGPTGLIMAPGYQAHARHERAADRRADAELCAERQWRQAVQQHNIACLPPELYSRWWQDWAWSLSRLQYVHDAAAIRLHVLAGYPQQQTADRLGLKRPETVSRYVARGTVQMVRLMAVKRAAKYAQVAQGARKTV